MPSPFTRMAIGNEVGVGGSTVAVGGTGVGVADCVKLEQPLMRINDRKIIPVEVYLRKVNIQKIIPNIKRDCLKKFFRQPLC
jgi:hypothetical protein